MSILYKDKILELLKDKDLIIESTDDRVPFNPDTQITSDTIELRLCPKGLVYKKDLQYADILSTHPDDFYEAVDIPLAGYLLKPNEVLFASALEIVCIANGGYAGRISSRGTYSRFGISVTCGRSKVPAGTPHTPDLQIVNHSSIPIKIYPYSFILQIQMETTIGAFDEYDGIYPKSIGPVPPKISQRDRSVSQLLTELVADEKSDSTTIDPYTTSHIVERLSSSIKPENRPEFKIILSTRLRSVLGLISGIITTLAGGYFVNMISTGDWSYWKYLSVTFAGILIVVLIILAIVITFGTSSE